MVEKLRGWEFTKTHEPLKFVEKDMPELKDDYVRIKVHNTGLCSSDVGALQDETWMGLITAAPCILGHEISGEIVELGADVSGWEIGQRVAVCPMAYKDDNGPGYGRDGGYGTYTTAPEEMLVKVPDGVSSEQAAASTDAGMTSYHAVVAQGGVKEGTKVGIIGLGGLGTVGMDVAIGLGAEVYVSTRKEAAQNKAKEHGAYKVASNIKEFKDDQLDVIIDFAGAGITTKEALETVKPGGRVVLVGMATLDISINGTDMILRETELVGSVGGTKQDIEDILNLMDQGKLTIATDPIPLSEVANGLEKLKNGQADDRQVMYTSEEDYK